MGTTAYQFKRLMTLMSTFSHGEEALQSERQYISPAIFRKTLPPYFRGYTQQDASELLRVLLDKMESELSGGNMKMTFEQKQSLLINRYLMGQ